ncbi:hypothetical protein DAPPUDRAFT_249275 [Daphnia pulex]|uniref:C1q domain-containing protein n=1 Tax=Daphnia pulex TaxID=6669 RepID=E9GWB5_DAPPU|nr:hypothetical protein DAPPUDRAFT_249275 [Daphnia pulex]|eukprot:EFX76223.1 hypothetical protein DAPPUDRAFT_249275 [Daphnia pulex]
MIGYIDVQTSPVYFHAQRSSGYRILKTVIPFDLLRLNLGNTMNTSGIFVAPTSGKYFFSYSGLSLSNALGRAEMQLQTANTANWVKIGQGYGTATFQTISLQANLELAKGDQIRLLLAEGAIYDDVSRYTNHVGLEEKIIQ